jgi:hypothetical protein
MPCGCAERRAAIKEAWHRVRGLALMSNGDALAKAQQDRFAERIAQDRLAVERIERQNEVMRQQRELTRMSTRSRAR